MAVRKRATAKQQAAEPGTAGEEPTPKKTPRKRAKAEAGRGAGEATAKPKRAPKAARPKQAATRKTPSGKIDEAALEKSGAGKSLVIVESPTKSKTLTKFLGKGFMVMASNGHIMDLPKSKLGVDVDRDFEPQYELIATKKDIVAKIRAAAKGAVMIYLAPDPDREGEAIACHLATVLKGASAPIRRLTFNEITQRAVTEALNHSRDLDLNLYNAQQGRRVLDRLVGYKVSPFVWSTVKYGLSAGRVQSVALRLICEREALIRAFVPEEYWTVEVDYQTVAGERFTSRLVRVGEEKLKDAKLSGADAAERAAALGAELASAPARVAGVEVRPKRESAKPPFITSTLQQVASNRLGFTSQRTMQVAQKLYEGIEVNELGSVGLITYMRTDSPRLSDEAVVEIRGWLGTEFGPEYVPEKPNVYKGRKSAQDAHEAIRPTATDRTPESLRPYLSDEQFKLYDIIWKRAVASQATPALKDLTSVDIESGRLGLRASGSVLRFPGWLRVYGRDEDDEVDEDRLPDLAQDDRLEIGRAHV